MKGAGCFWKFQEDWKIISVFPGSGATYTLSPASRLKREILFSVIQDVRMKPGEIYKSFEKCPNHSCVSLYLSG